MNPETCRKLRRMRLPAFAKAYQEQSVSPELYASMTFDERLTLLVDTEFDSRTTNKMEGWHKHLGSGGVADTLLDRITSNGYEVNIDGDVSMRRRHSRI